MSSDQSRNLNPHAAARAAMWLFGRRYSEFGGGSMDFWDSLSRSDKRNAAMLAKEIREARPYTGTL